MQTVFALYQFFIHQEILQTFAMAMSLLRAAVDSGDTSMCRTLLGCEETDVHSWVRSSRGSTTPRARRTRGARPTRRGAARAGFARRGLPAAPGSSRGRARARAVPRLDLWLDRRRADKGGRARLPPLRQRWRRLTLASLSRYARGDINRSRKLRRLPSPPRAHDAGM